jgi:putative ATP-binding cassette transporter
MADSAQGEAAAAEEAGQAGLLGQLALILGALRGSEARRPILSLILALGLVLVGTAYSQIRLNSWNKPFYDALSRRDLHDFLFQLGVFLVIAGVLLVLNVAQRWLVETLKWRLRQGLVTDLVEHWMRPRRAFWLAHGGAMGVNPDQRMHEDARKLCELSADLGVGLSQASILFLTFAGILWVLSADFSFNVAGEDYRIPGFMLWAAVFYAGLGSWLSYRVGNSLIGRNAQRYAREADLRFSLVRVNEHLDGISLAAGEGDERRRVELDLQAVLRATARLVTGLTNLTWVTAGFGWITLVAPILVATPLFFSGKITFGGLMMAAAAFTQAQSSLRWFVDNFSIIADWRATLLRVAGFRQALLLDEQRREGVSHIGYAEGPAGSLLIENLAVDSPGGRDRLEETRIEIHAGERVLLSAAPGTGKSQLFRALAGLWPWGAGQVTRPAGSAVFHMPRGTPYLPRGTLREVLAYPGPADGYAAERYEQALRRFGLQRLLPLLDLEQRWERELGQDEQQALAFARMLLQAPAWVLIDDAFATLDEALLDQVGSVLAGELAGTALVHVGRPGEGREKLFSRTIHLVKAEPAP